MKNKILRNLKKISIFAGAIALAVFIIGATNVKAAVTTVPLSGWAWSSTIGWIDLSKVNVDKGTGIFSGYGWSSNIGWVSFNTADVSGCPGGSCTPTVNPVDGKITGFIRACAGTVSGDCQGVSRTDGWDGWIELSGANHTSPDTTGAGGVSYDSAAKKIVGYAWGSEVVGWLNFVNVGAPLDGSVCANGASDYPDCTLSGPVTVTAATGARCGGRIQLSWTTSPGATSYHVSRSLSSSSGFTDIAATTSTSYVDAGLNPAATYYYKIVATGPSGDTAPSAVQSAPSSAACPATSCLGPDDAVINSGESRVYYNSVAGKCDSRTLTCNNTVLTPAGTYTLASAGSSCTGILPTITQFKMDPDTANAGGSCNMIWTSTNADSCTIKGPGFGTAGANAVTSGSKLTPPISGTSPYTLTCTSSAGSVSKTAVCRLNASIHEN